MCAIRKSVVIGLLLWLPPLANLAGAEAAQLTSGRREIVVHASGHDWTVSIQVPKSYDASKPTPVVLILHGAGGNGGYYLEQAGWTAKAEAEGFIAVAPDGLPVRPGAPDNLATNPRVWNSGQLTPFGPRARIDDLAFFGALLDEIERRANVDRGRIYLAGHSNGAGMTYRLAAEMPERFAAIAPVASQCWVEKPRPKRPLPTLFIIGTADPLVPFQGGESTLPWGGKRYTPPVEDSLKKWARAIGSSPESVAVTETNGARVIEFPPQANGALLRACFIQEYGHQWPGGRQRLRARLQGESPSLLNATDVIWEFFEEQHRAALAKSLK
jgi:polyhydroxybutyrate depolymerase